MFETDSSLEVMFSMLFNLDFGNNTTLLFYFYFS